MTIELSEKQFNNTFSGNMIDITETVEPIFDIWPYVKLLLEDNIVTNYIYDNKLVEKVYTDEAGHFHQVLLPTEIENVFIVIIIDTKEKNIIGHFRLDLNNKY